MRISVSASSISFKIGSNFLTRAAFTTVSLYGKKINLVNFSSLSVQKIKLHPRILFTLTYKKNEKLESLLKVWTTIKIHITVHFWVTLLQKSIPFFYVREDISLQNTSKSSTRKFSLGTPKNVKLLDLCTEPTLQKSKSWWKHLNFWEIRKYLELIPTRMVPC